MNRLGYLVVIVVILCLAGYLFWPQAVTGEGVPVFNHPAPGEFTVKSGGLDQRVAGRSVSLAGLDRPVDDQRVTALWNLLRAITVPRDHIVAGIAADQLSAYGIDGTREIAAAGATLRWGGSGNHGYLWDGERVFSVPQALIERLDAASGRLDVQTALPAATSLERVESGDVVFERGPHGWWDPRHPERPTANVRVGRLMANLAGIRLADLSASTAGDPICVLRVKTSHPAPEDHVITLGALPGGAAGGSSGGTITIDALPAQRIGIDAYAAWKAACDDLSRFYLADLDASQARVDTQHLVAQLGGRPWFTADRRQQSYRPGETEWDVSWEGGREAASEESVARLLEAIASIVIEDPAAGPSPLAASLTARRFTLIQQNGGVNDITLDGDQAWTAAHHGRVPKPPPLLVALEPASLLDLALTIPAPERVEKLQRQERALQPPTQEVVARAEDGTWSRTFPVATTPGRVAVDAVVVGRLARALCAARATSVRLLTDEDRATLDHPVFELDVRFAPRSAGAPSMEIADERDTVPQDRGFAFAPSTSDPGWRAVDKEGGVSYLIDAETVEILRAPFEADALFPVVPGLVRAIEISTTKDRYVLERGGQGWTVRSLEPANGTSPPPPPMPADEIEVRRLFRDLADLRAVAREPTARPLLPSAATASISCLMPASDGGMERLTLTLGAPEGDTAPASVDSTRIQTPLPKGRVRVAAAALAKVVPDRTRFSTQRSAPLPSPLPSPLPAPPRAP